MDAKEFSRQYWNSVAGKKTFTVPLPASLITANIPRTDVILDFGCGYGRSLAELNTLGYRRLRGCDISPNMISLAQAQVPDAELKVNDASSIPFPDDSCDAVLLLAVLTSIVADADQTALLAEIYRVLRPGGALIVGDFLLNADSRNLERYRRFESQFGTYGVFALPEGAVLRHHRRADLNRLFAAFTEQEFRETVYNTMNGHQSNGFYFLGRK